jgi:2-dehydro-3-deoxyphosphogluconate aldolase/(4S)-4-hydroxy-2-oxoglutarate aldolase
MVLESLIARAPVVPVIVVERVEDAAPLARALVAGGLSALEVTLRTPVALDVIREMRAAVPEALVGAGTINRPADLVAAMEAGAEFGVSPGAPARLIAAVKESGLPFLPGSATATEAMELVDQGFTLLKCFPASSSGGPEYLKNIASPLPEAKFCPTGGVTMANATDYLSLPNVAVVGGSFVCPKALIDAGDWDAITAIARKAAALPR